MVIKCSQPAHVMERSSRLLHSCTSHRAPRSAGERALLPLGPPCLPELPLSSAKLVYGWPLWTLPCRPVSQCPYSRSQPAFHLAVLQVWVLSSPKRPQPRPHNLPPQISKGMAVLGTLHFLHFRVCVTVSKKVCLCCDWDHTEPAEELGENRHMHSVFRAVHTACPARDQGCP